MKALARSKVAIALTALVVAGIIALPLAISTFSAKAVHAAKTSSNHYTVNCSNGVLARSVCTEVYDSESVFGEDVYVGHDEPATLFYSNKPGSGTRQRYELTLPKDPPPAPIGAGTSFNFQLHPAFWFGMAMCDTQSYPEQLSTCAAGSDKNIVDPAISPKHPGTAFMEMQFYPPGWAPWPAGVSCDPTKWCAALNIDSLSVNPVTGQSQNPTCAAITGLEYVNFAFITKSGVPQPNSPPNPVQSTVNTFTPDPNADLFMNSGDDIAVTLHDTANGLQINLDDHTSGQSGSMTASAANGFAMVQFDPTGTSCNAIPYNFHPMYSTSSEKTRVPWAAHSYNIAFSDEIGHFDYCTTVTSTGGCADTEGLKNDQEPTDADDVGCFPASTSLLVQVSGCIGSNTGFDGSSYQPVWPDGSKKHPTPIRFTSPLTGSDYSVNYNRMGFEADLPRIETGVCNRGTGVGCTLIPITDDGTPAVFYPFFSIANVNHDCVWQLGNHIPGSKNDFGQNQQYGTLLNLTYTSGTGIVTRFNDYRQVLSHNPCPSND